MYVSGFGKPIVPFRNNKKQQTKIPPDHHQKSPTLT